MSLLYADSFDGYVTADLLDNFDFVSGPVIQAATGRFGTNCLKINDSQHVAKQFNPAKQTFIVGAAFRIDSSDPEGLAKLIRIRHAPDNTTGVLTEVCQVRLNPNQTLSFVRGDGTATLGTTTFVTHSDVYYYLELKVTISTTVGSYEIRLNEATVLSGSGVNTDGTGKGYANQVRLEGGGAVRDCLWDDFYVCDSLGANNNDFLGDVHIEATLANAAGSNTQMNPVQAAPGTPVNWQEIDDAAPDDENTYVSGTASAQKDTYNFTNTAIPYSNIKAVLIKINARGGDADGTPIVRGVVRETGVDYSGTNTLSVPGVAAYKYRQDIFEVNPNGSAAWTRAQVDAAEFGIEVV